MRTTDFMTPQQQQDLRDAGRGHLIDGGRAAALIDKADEMRKREREEGDGGSGGAWPDGEAASPEDGPDKAEGAE